MIAMRLVFIRPFSMSGRQPFGSETCGGGDFFPLVRELIRGDRGGHAPPGFHNRCSSTVPLYPADTIGAAHRCRGGETGRRTGLKILGPQGRAGSIPAPGTSLLKI